MTAVFALGPCCCCHSVFSFNPDLVPSFKGDPICRDCIELINRKRAELGNPLWPIPPGAYDPEYTEDDGK